MTYLSVIGASRRHRIQHRQITPWFALVVALAEITYVQDKGYDGVMGSSCCSPIMHGVVRGTR